MHDFADLHGMNLHKFRKLQCNQSLNIWPMIAFCCSNKRMVHLIHFIQRGRTVLLLSLNYISFRSGFFQISDIYPVILTFIMLSNCNILQSSQEFEPQSGHLMDAEDILLPEKLSCHLTWPSFSNGGAEIIYP